MPEKATAAPPVAKATVRPGTLQRKCACGGTPGASGMCPQCERRARGELQRKEAGAGTPAVPASVGSVLASPGVPLDSGTRATMERGFGTDLGGVRLHNDAAAGESARAVDAHAYTVGNDIAFAPGKYDPHSEGGQRLLAHEIAHTVQQGGLQRAAATSLEVSPAYSAAEAEADRAADAVMAGRGAPRLGPTGPTVARAPATPKGASSDSDDDVWAGLDKTKLTASGKGGADVESILAPPGGEGDPIYVIRELPVPEIKGADALKLYQDAAKAGTLMATYDVSQDAVSVKQDHIDTDLMAALWLQKVGWTPGAAAGNWSTVTGDKKKAEFEARIGKRLCYYDHVIELQLGGSQASDNVQLLDQRPNSSSGSTLRQDVARRARIIKAAHNKGKKKPRIVTMKFARAAGATVEKDFSVKGKSCLDLDKAARGLQATAPDTAGAAGAANTKILYGERGSDIYLAPNAPTSLGSGAKTNVGVIKLIPGFLLDTYVPGKKGDTVEAEPDVDTLVRSGKAKSSIALVVKSSPKVFLDAKNAEAPSDKGLAQKQLKFNKMENKLLKFYYPGLSEGELKLNYDEKAGDLTGKGGKFKSDKPILKDLDLGLELTPDVLAVIAKASPKSLSFMPGGTVKRADLRVSLLPELGGKGTIEVAFGHYATAAVAVTVNAQGIQAEGDLALHIPRLDTAAGKVQYRDGSWSGSFDVAVSSAKIPGFQSASLHVDFAGGKVSPHGTVNLRLLDTDVALRASLEGDAWLFAASVPRLKIPGLDGPISVDVVYSRGKLVATGQNASFTFGKWNGTLKKLTYEDGRLSGSGSVTVGKPEDRVSGTINATLLPSGKWTADGTVSVRIKEGLVATVGIQIDEAQKVHVMGMLRFPDYEIPKTKFGNHYRKDLATLSFPIVGISVGPKTIGFSFDITAFVTAYWQIGPATLKDTTLKAEFDPFEEQTNYDLEGHTKLAVPMDLRFGAGIEGAFSLDLLIASGSFGVDATATLGVQAESALEGTLAYRNGNFSLDSKASITAHPYLTLNLDAFVRAKVAGFDPYEHTWPLKAWKFDSGFDIGVSAPIKYDAEKGLQLPGVSDVDVKFPDISLSDLMHKMVKHAGVG